MPLDPEIQHLYIKYQLCKIFHWTVGEAERFLNSDARTVEAFLLILSTEAEEQRRWIERIKNR